MLAKAMKVEAGKIMIEAGTFSTKIGGLVAESDCHN